MINFPAGLTQAPCSRCTAGGNLRISSNGQGHPNLQFNFFCPERNKIFGYSKNFSKVSKKQFLGFPKFNF
jgi:hypothetical protein